MWWNPFFISTVTKSSLGSINLATVLLFSHQNVTVQQLSFTTLTGLRFCIKRNLLFRFGTIKSSLSTLTANTRRRPNARPPSATLAQHQTSTGSTPRVCWAVFNSWSVSSYCWWRVKAKNNPMSVKCWASVASAGQYPSVLVSIQRWRDCVPIAYIAPMLFKCWPASYTMARHRTVTPTHCQLYRLYQHDALKQSWVNVGLSSLTLARIQCDVKHILAPAS